MSHVFISGLHKRLGIDSLVMRLDENICQMIIRIYLQRDVYDDIIETGAPISPVAIIAPASIDTTL